MSCVLELLGAVRMSREAYERFAECARELLASFDCAEYLEGRGEAVVHRFGPSCGAEEEVVALLARFKDRDGLDAVEWFGESGRGRYYVGRGRWCRVEAVIPPPPPEDSPQWREEG
ncbi:MAG: hypothetical protein ACPLRW_05630 [Moorellales bacterium]